jgi:hypothetical protein
MNLYVRRVGVIIHVAGHGMMLMFGAGFDWWEWFDGCP